MGVTQSLVQKFDLKLPLFLAPMAGGPTTPELVAAVNDAGGMGFLGIAYMKPAEIEATFLQLRRLSNRPFGVNLFVPSVDPEITATQLQRALSATQKYRSELGLPSPTLQPPYSENFERQFEVVLQQRPDALSFTFGLLPPHVMKECKRMGIFTIGTATTLVEAKAIEDSGADAVVLQGFEGGGHRGIFDMMADDPNISAIELTKICAQKIKIPLICAGGIMDGAGIAKAIHAGAQVAQLGTAFLTCDEAGTSMPYRRALLEGPRTTRLTRAFSGRLARGIENRFMQEMDVQPEAILPFPAHNVFTRDLRKASAAQDKSDFISLWAGSQVKDLRPMKAAELVKTLQIEFEKAFKP